MARQTLPLFEGLERADEDSLSFTSLFTQESNKLTLKSYEILHKLIRMLESTNRSHPFMGGFICLGFDQFSLLTSTNQILDSDVLLPVDENPRWSVASSMFYCACWEVKILVRQWLFEQLITFQQLENSYPRVFCFTLLILMRFRGTNLAFIGWTFREQE